MKITWSTFKWLVLAGFLPPLFFKIQATFSGQFEEAFNAWNDLILWFLISVGYTLFLAFIVLKEIYWLQKLIPWKKHPALRLLVEIVLTNATVLSAMFFLSQLTWSIKLGNALHSNLPFRSHLFTELTTGFVMNFLIISITEGNYFFTQWKTGLILSERLQKENMQSQLDVLKNQVNPHFLFNSLNVLSSLVHSDPNKAEEFIDEFASVYRYILSIQGKIAVSVNEELKFLNSYMFLQKIRFNEGVEMHTHVQKDDLNSLLPPLSLQLLVENAIKHNIVSKEQPLKIKIFSRKGELHVINNLQKREVGHKSTGMGLKNLKERYFILAKIEPVFKIKNNEYMATIPLLKTENEDIDDHEKCKFIKKCTS